MPLCKNYETTGDVTGTVLDTDDTQLGQFYLEDGDTIIRKTLLTRLLRTSKASVPGLGSRG